jgi:hypothetical protein
VSACPSCGASSLSRGPGGFVCAYCGCPVTPRLLPDALCDDRGPAGGCGTRAESLCRGCARPLCDRHNDPKFLYWNAALGRRSLMPHWTRQEERDWDRLTAPLPKLPVPGVAPFEWRHHHRQSQYETGELEAEILGRVRALAEAVDGDANESGCRFKSLCHACTARLETEIEAAVRPYAERYRALAFANRLDALEADLHQAQRYVEAFLRHPVPEGEAEEDGILPELAADGPAEDWLRCGRELRARLEAAARLAHRLRG